MTGSKDDVIKLITQIPDGSEIGKRETEVLSEKKSVTRSEFYAAYGLGLSAKYVFSIHPDDFELSSYMTADGNKLYASQIWYDGIIYEIIRTFQKSEEGIEIVVK